MLFSSYRRWSIVLAAVGLAAISFVLVSVSLVLGLILSASLCVFFGIALWIHFGNIEDVLAQSRGVTPMPNMGVGYLGVYIVDDKAAASFVDPMSDAAIDYTSNELDQHPFAAHCPYCHAVLPNPSVRFCNGCGKELRSVAATPSSGTGSA